MTTYAEWIGALDLAIMWDFGEVSELTEIHRTIFFHSVFLIVFPRFERHVSGLFLNSSNQGPSSTTYFLLENTRLRSGCGTDMFGFYNKKKHLTWATTSATQG